MKPFGLGDLAYYAFRPAVLVIDAVWGTDLRDCDVCKARRKRWNALASVPGWMAFLGVTVLSALLVWRMVK